jgi:hypothetical protein
MTEPNLSALTKMEQLVFGADAKKDAAGNIIEQGHGNLHDRVKKVEAALKAAVPNIAPETVAAIAQQSVLTVPSVGVPVQPVPVAPVTPVPTTPAAVTVAPAPVTPAPVAVAPIPEPAVAVAAAVTPAVAGVASPTAPVTPAAPAINPAPVTIEAVQAVVPDVHPSVVAAVIATNPKASHETIVAKLKAFLAEAETKIEEIL